MTSVAPWANQELRASAGAKGEGVARVRTSEAEKKGKDCTGRRRTSASTTQVHPPRWRHGGSMASYIRAKRKTRATDPSSKSGRRRAANNISPAKNPQNSSVCREQRSAYRPAEEATRQAITSLKGRRGNRDRTQREHDDSDNEPTATDRKQNQGGSTCKGQ